MATNLLNEQEVDQISSLASFLDMYCNTLIYSILLKFELDLMSDEICYSFDALQSALYYTV